MKKTAFVAVVGIALLFIIFAVFIYVAPHIGWSVNAVISGSMEPALETGSLIVTRPAEPEDIRVGDIILYRPVFGNGNMITHRVVGIEVNSPIKFVTQGDANLTPDSYKIPGENLVGKVFLHIPLIGSFTEFVKTLKGFISLIVVPSIIILSIYIFSVWQAINENRKQKVNAQA
jgi:signal peptidase